MTEADFFNVIQIVCQFFVYIEIDDVVSTVTPITLVNVNAPVVATTSWWLHFSAQVVA